MFRALVNGTRTHFRSHLDSQNNCVSFFSPHIHYLYRRKKIQNKKPEQILCKRILFSFILIKWIFSVVSSNDNVNNRKWFKLNGKS